VVAVRFAPSSTGSLRIGNALTAVANPCSAELRDAGGDLGVLPVALRGPERAPELRRVVADLPPEEALRRVDAAL
jgi:hypothetical protein